MGPPYKGTPLKDPIANLITRAIYAVGLGKL